MVLAGRNPSELTVLAKKAASLSVLGRGPSVGLDCRLPLSAFGEAAGVWEFRFASRFIALSSALGPSGGAGWSSRVAVAVSMIGSSVRPRSWFQRCTWVRAGQPLCQTQSPGTCARSRRFAPRAVRVGVGARSGGRALARCGGLSEVFGAAGPGSPLRNPYARSQTFEWSHYAAAAHVARRSALEIRDAGPALSCPRCCPVCGFRACRARGRADVRVDDDRPHPRTDRGPRPFPVPRRRTVAAQPVLRRPFA